MSSLPSDPLEFYAFTSKPTSAIKVHFDSFAKALSAGRFEPLASVIGWAFFECPTPPQMVARGPDSHIKFATCINRYLRLTLRSNDGVESTEVAATVGGGQDADLNSLESHKIDILPSPTRDMAKVRVIRPYPQGLYWAVVPKLGKSQAFDDNMKQK